MHDTLTRDESLALDRAHARMGVHLRRAETAAQALPGLVPPHVRETLARQLAHELDSAADAVTTELGATYLAGLREIADVSLESLTVVWHGDPVDWTRSPNRTLAGQILARLLQLFGVLGNHHLVDDDEVNALALRFSLDIGGLGPAVWAAAVAAYGGNHDCLDDRVNLTDWS